MFDFFNFEFALHLLNNDNKKPRYELTCEAIFLMILESR